MKLWTLIENTASCPALQAEHGLSLYLETGKHRILFDSGQSDAFARNAEAMGIDLSRVDMAVLSHGHYDHGGGLLHFLQINSTASVYVNQNVFRPYYHGPQKYIGLDPALAGSGRIVPVGDFLELDDGIILRTCNGLPRAYPMSNADMLIKEGDRFVADQFLHEQYLQVEENGRRILFSGCSHKGILNIETWFRPDVLIGGFHFKNLDPSGPDSRILEQAAETLLQFPTRYYTAHCTGLAQYEFLKTLMGDRLSYLSAGSAVTI